MSSKYGNKKKSEQLGMAHGTAANKLRKMIMFSLVRETGRDFCYRCKERIESIDTLSVEHIEPWLDSKNPVELYFNLENIAFSHTSCNAAGARRYNKGIIVSKHGTINRYNKYGCRCDKCRAVKVMHNNKYNERS